MSDASSLASGITIRTARPDEIDRIADIVNDPPNAGAVRIAGSAAKAVAGGRVLARAGLSLRVASTVVAELDGKVVGIMDAGTHHSEAAVTPMIVVRLLPRVVSTIGLGGLVRLLRSRAAWARVGFPTNDASYYVAELDVDPAYRNNGIGGALLVYGEAHARKLSAPAMTLTTDITNPAQHLYERHGFRITETKRDAEYERWTDSPGRVLMRKDLA